MPLLRYFDADAARRHGAALEACKMRGAPRVAYAFMPARLLRYFFSSMIVIFAILHYAFPLLPLPSSDFHLPRS